MRHNSRTELITSLITLKTYNFKMKYIPNYHDPKVLKNYAIWYYEKYFPSASKLKIKLLMKNNSPDIVD